LIDLKDLQKKAIKQRILRNKKRIECSNAKIAFKNWIKKVRQIRRKFRLTERKNRRIERVTLVKKFESMEIKYKFIIDHKEIKINKNIKKIKQDLSKVKEQTKESLKLVETIEKNI